MVVVPTLTQGKGRMPDLSPAKAPATSAHGHCCRQCCCWDQLHQHCPAGAVLLNFGCATSKAAAALHLCTTPAVTTAAAAVLASTETAPIPLPLLHLQSSLSITLQLLLLLLCPAAHSELLPPQMLANIGYHHCQHCWCAQGQQYHFHTYCCCNARCQQHHRSATTDAAVAVLTCSTPMRLRGAPVRRGRTGPCS
jgi:hypothetical protein